MNKKEIIILAAIGAGVYILSQVKAMKTYIAPQHAKTAAEKAAAQKKIRQEAAQKIAQRIAQKVAQKVAPKRIGQPTTWLEHIAALRKAAREKAAVRKAAAQKIGKKIGKTVARKAAVRKAAVRKVAPWKAPYKFPKSNFRVITPSDKLQNLAKKDIARKKAVQQKKVQKTTPSTPSARRKKRLEALYGSHWHDIWVQRQRR